MDAPKDVCGYQISVGDYMIQAYNKGRSAALKFTRVVGIKDGKVRVIGCQDGWKAGTWRKTQATTLNYPDRSMIIPMSHVPRDAWLILKDGEDE